MFNLCRVILLMLVVSCPSLAAGALSAPGSATAKDYYYFTGQVVGVSDGDTITVLFEKRPIKVRLYGIDCPEKGQPFSQAAKNFSSQQAFGKRVEVLITDRDRDGREIGIVTLPDKQTLNGQLVMNGLAWWYRKYALNDGALQTFENHARRKRWGLRAGNDPFPPWEGRKSKQLRRISRDNQAVLDFAEQSQWSDWAM